MKFQIGMIKFMLNVAVENGKLICDFEAKIPLSKGGVVVQGTYRQADEVLPLEMNVILKGDLDHA